jgi:hypothetical protein
MQNISKKQADLLFNIVTTKLDMWYIEQIWLSGRSCRKSSMAEHKERLEALENDWESAFGTVPTFTDVDAMVEWLHWYEDTFDCRDKVDAWFKIRVY